MAAITLSQVGKRYRVTEDDGLFIKRIAKAVTGRRSARELWALRNIDLEVPAGQTIGVIGRNGSGKTTLLRLLSGVSAPTTGRLRVEGSIAPLIGVGVGFNPELTGRENVFANGRILGLTKEQLRRDFDDIVAFAELEDFVETPVKFYSSGMFLRLAFAVAIQVEPEVLLVDEVLAVGDLAFQLKCLERMRALQERGTTTVIVTHNLGMLGRMCDRVIVLSHGQVRFDGPVDEAIGAYHAVMREEQAARSGRTSLTEQEGDQPLYGGGADVEVDVLDDAGVPTTVVAAGGPACLRIVARFDSPVVDPLLGLAIACGPYGNVYMAHTMPGQHPGAYGPDRPLEATVQLATPLLTGSYHAHVNVLDADGSLIIGSSVPTPFHVNAGGAFATGVVDLEAEIHIDGAPVIRLARPDAVDG